MFAKSFLSVAACVAFTGLAVSTASASTTIPTVPIGNPGNAPDPLTGGRFGSVAYTYNIGRTEVTNAQYAAFLNAKAKSDPLGLYNNTGTITAPGGMAGSFGGITRSGSAGSYTYSTVSGRANNPVNFVRFWDAIRFVNWLHNGQGNGDTETGAYTLTPDGIANNTVTRNAGWRWAVASENEWYKAAFHQPASAGGDSDNYWLYTTSSNTAPIPGVPGSGTGQANFGHVVGNTTPVGSYAPNFYGTFDMGGNVWEMSDTIVGGTARGLRGGMFTANAHGYNLSSQDGVVVTPSAFSETRGFRVVQVPTPGAAAMLGLGGLFAAGGRRRR